MLLSTAPEIRHSSREEITSLMMGSSGLFSPEWTTRIISPSPVPQNINRKTNAAVNDTNRTMLDLHPRDVMRRSGSGTNLRDIASIQLLASTDLRIPTNDGDSRPSRPQRLI